MTQIPFQDVNIQVNFFAENLKVFKKVFLPLFALVVLSSTVDRYLSLLLENTLNNPDGAQQQTYFIGFLSIISSIFFPVLLITLALFALCSLDNQKKVSFGAFLHKNLNLIFIETLRSWGKTLLWSLLFILPGLWKFIEYSLVPLVVTTSKDYDEGKVDALEASGKIVRKNGFKITGLFILFHLFIPLVMSAAFDAYSLIWKTPISSLFLSAIDTYLLLFSTHILFKIFISEENQNVSAHV